MDKKIVVEHLGPQPNRFEAIESSDYNVTVNEAEATKPRLMNIGILNPPIRVLNRSSTAASSCSRTIPTIPVGGRSSIGVPVVRYQTLQKLSAPYRIVPQTPLPPRANAAAQTFPTTSQLLNLQAGSYTTVPYPPHQNYYSKPPIQGANASSASSSHGYSRIAPPPQTSWQPVPNVLKGYYTVPKGYDEGASTSWNPPPDVDIPKNTGRPTKQRSIQISKKNLTALETVASSHSTKKVPPSSVASFLEQDTLQKGLEVLDSLDDQSLKLLVSKVMELTNKLYGDYLAEELEKYLGVEKYQEIASNAYDEFLARSGCDKENRLSASAAEGSASASAAKVEKQTVFFKMDPETSLRTDNATVNASEVGVSQKGKGKKVKHQRGVRKAQSRGKYEIDERNMSLDSQEILSAFGSPKTSTPTLNSIKRENSDSDDNMNGFAWTDTKTAAVKVAQEISAADVFISDKIAELKKGGNTPIDSLEDDFTFDDSKTKNGLPEKIFDSPDNPAAIRTPPRTSLRVKCQPRKLLHVDNNWCIKEEPFLGKNPTLKDEVGEMVDSRRSGGSNFKPKMPPKRGQTMKTEDASTYSTYYVDVDVPSSRLKPKISEKPRKHSKQARQQPDKGEFFTVVPLRIPLPINNIQTKVCVPSPEKVVPKPNNTPVRCQQRVKSEPTVGFELLPAASSKPDNVCDYKRVVSSLYPEISLVSTSSTLESTFSGSGIMEAPNQTSEGWQIVEVNSQEIAANRRVIPTPKCQIVNGGTRGPEVGHKPTTNFPPGKSFKNVDPAPTKECFVDRSLSPCVPTGQGKKMWQESEYVYNSNCPETSAVSKKVVVTQSFKKVGRKPTINILAHTSLRPPTHGSGKSMWEATDEYVYKSNGPQQTVPVKIEEVVITESCQKVDEEQTNNSLVNQNLSPNGPGKSMPTIWQEPEYQTSDGPQTTVPDKDEEVVITQSCKEEEVDQKPTKNSLATVSLSSVPEKVVITQSCRIEQEPTVGLCPPNGQGNRNMPQMCQETEYVKQHSDRSLKSCNNDGAESSSLDEPKEPTAIIIKEEPSGKNEHNITKAQRTEKRDTFLEISEESAKKDVTPKNTHFLSQKTTKSSKSVNYPKTTDESDRIIQLHVAISTTEIVAQSPYASNDQKYKTADVSQTKASKIVSPVSDSALQHHKALEQNSYENKVDTGNLSEYPITSQSEHGDRTTENPNAESRHVNSSFPSTKTAIKLEEQVTRKMPQKLQTDDDNENPEAKAQQLEKDGNGNPVPKSQTLDKDDNDSTDQKPANVSSDIETSMNDLAQLLISLQDTTPIATGTSDTSSISNESFERFARNSAKTLDLENDDCILVENDDPATKTVQKSPRFCEVFVKPTAAFCGTPIITGASKTGHKKVPEKDCIKRHDDKSVRDIAQLLMDFQKSVPNKLESSEGFDENMETVGGDDCILVEDTSPMQDPLEICSQSDKCAVNSTDDCVLIEVQSVRGTETNRNSNDDCKVDLPPLTPRIIPTSSGLKRAKESCDTFNAYRPRPPKKIRDYEQEFVKRNPLSWARGMGDHKPSTSVTILDYAKPSASGNKLLCDRYRKTNDPEDFNTPIDPSKPRVVQQSDTSPKLIISRGLENVREKSTDSSSHNFPMPVALVACSRTGTNSKRTAGITPSKIIDINWSASSTGVIDGTFRRLDYKSADYGSGDVNPSSFVTPEVTVSRRARTREEQTTDLSRQSNVRPVAKLNVKRGQSREGRQNTLVGRAKDVKVKKEDEERTFVDLSGSIVETPASSRDCEVVVPRYRRMRQVRKLREHQQRNVLRSKVRSFSQLIGRRIKAARRTFNQMSLIVNLININRNDVSLDNHTLTSKVSNLKAIYHTINKTFVAFNENDGHQLKTTFRQVHATRLGQARIVQVGVGRRRSVPKEDGRVPSTQSAKLAVPKCEDTKYRFPPVPQQFKKEVLTKPIKTYSKNRKSIIKDILDSSVGGTRIFGNEAAIPFKRSASFLDDVRQSSLNRDRNVQQVNNTANPESIVTRNVGSETIPDPLEFLPTRAAQSIKKRVVVKQEPVDVPEWEVKKSENIQSEPVKRGVKRKAEDRKKKPIKKEEPSPVATTRNLRNRTVSDPTPPSKKKRATKTVEVRGTYSLRSRSIGNKTIT